MGYETLTETEWEAVDRIWELLEETQVERARLELETLQRNRPRHPDLKIVEAAIALDEGEPRAALEALRGAERSADPALFFHLRAVSQYELAGFEQARDDAERALAIRPDVPETHDLLSRALDHLGDLDGSREHAEEAQRLDSESFPGPLEVEEEEFDALVQKSLAELPEEVRRHLAELPVVVERLPQREFLIAEEPPLSPDILGLFVGTHLRERSHVDPARAPGAIFLFRHNLLRVSSDVEELEREIRTTVQHEVGHLLGLDEDDLDRWGLA